MNSRFEKSNAASDRCKIFGNTTLDLRAHAARCQGRDVLLYCPCPTDEELEIPGSLDEIRAACIAWSGPSRSTATRTLPITFVSPSRSRAHRSGFECSISAEAADSLRLSLGYTYLMQRYGW